MTPAVYIWSLIAVVVTIAISTEAVMQACKTNGYVYGIGDQYIECTHHEGQSR